MMKKKEKYDLIWVKVVAENEDIRFTGLYTVMYKLFDDGWHLASVGLISNDYTALEELDEARIKEDILSEYGEIVTVYFLEDINIDVKLPLDTDSQKTIDLTCVATARNDRMDVEATIHVIYVLKMDFNYCGWQLTECEMLEYSYYASTEPSNELLSETTNEWERGFTLIESNKTGDNEYTYMYNRIDKNTFKGVEVEWDTSLTYVFVPEYGWQLAYSNNELKNVTVTIKGTWTYKSSYGDVYTLKVNSVDGSKINFDIDITWVPTLWGSTGTRKPFCGCESKLVT